MSQDSPLEGGSALSPLLLPIQHLTRPVDLTQGLVSRLSQMKQRGRTLGFLHIDTRSSVLIFIFMESYTPGKPLVIFLQMIEVLVHLVLQYWHRLAHGQE